jgi:PLP dependent protein
MTDWPLLSSVAERVAHLRHTIPAQTRIVAVTKTVPIELMREAYAAGIRDFGENRVQEAIAKQELLSDLNDITWHFIGHLQSNKAKQAITHFQWLQSVDSLALAQRLDRLAAELNLRPQVCLQVKLRNDPGKFGWTPQALLDSLTQLRDCRYLAINGLMAILPANLSEDEQLRAFLEIQALADQIRHHSTAPLPLSELSTGMSGDYKIALKAGATMIRPGRLLFGDRPTAV